MNKTAHFLDIIKDAIPDTPENREALEALKQDPPCYYPWAHVLVDQDGGVTVCCLNKHKIGDLNNHTMQEIWNGEKIQDLREQFLDHDYTSCTLRCPFVLGRVRGGKPCKPPRS